jgi:ABC-type multidrug transport system ATPase subunit/ABC-type transporter Mla maintaining outer membrane lipid asymmetry permease subunit MlaE
VTAAAPAASDGPALAALSLRGFALAYRVPGGRLKTVFEGVDLDVPAGRFYLIIGPSGSGKSTLLRLLTGLWESREAAPRYAGEASVLGRSVIHGYPAALRGEVTAVLQDEGLLDELSPRANVRMALRAAGRSRKLDIALLGQAGLPDPPAEVASLSGGMRKRVAVARALAAEPRLCVFDEPTAGLDPASARDIANLLKQTHTAAAGARTTFVVTHDVDAFLGVVDAVLCLEPHRRALVMVPPSEVDPSGETTKANRLAPPSEQPDENDAIPGLSRARALLLSVAGAVSTCGEALYRLPPVYPGLVARTALRFTLEPIAFACLGSSVIGGLATYFALRNNPLEGAFISQVITGSGKVLTAVLIPLMVGFFFTARMAAGAAARVGTMKRSNQVAALRLMGIHPADYLLTPMLWGMVIAMPIVTAAGLAGAALASLLAARMVTGIHPHGWAMAFFNTVDARDLEFGLLKTLLSGLLVAVLTYHLGTGPKRSGQDVGEAVNSAIVGGMVLVLAVHGSLTLVQF